MASNDAFFEQLAKAFPGDDDSPWYVYAGVVFQAHDHMDMIAELWHYMAKNTGSVNAKVTKARKLREALLKASVLVGFPKGINACTTLRAAIKSDYPAVEDELDRDPSLRQHLSRAEKDARGSAFFSKIYAQHTDRVLHNMSLASGGDLSEFAINAVYGDLMAETSRLDAKETGLLEFVCCYTAGGSVWSQAKGHMYGSHNLGNGKAEILGAVEICKAVERELKIEVRREEGKWEWVAKAEGW